MENAKFRFENGYFFVKIEKKTKITFDKMSKYECRI